MTKEEKIAKQIDEFVGTGGHPAIVLYALQDAMYETAQHLILNWQDTRMGKVWDSAAQLLSRPAGLMGQALEKVGYAKP